MSDNYMDKTIEPNKSFGELLRKFRRREGVNRAELAERITMSVMTVLLYETNTRSPTLARIEDISKALELSEQETNELIDAALYDRTRDQGFSAPSSYQTSVQLHPLATSDTVSDLELQFKEMQGAIEDLSKRLEATKSPDPTPDEHQVTIAEELQYLKQSLTQIQSTTQEITAPVRYPSRDEMRVNLVPSTYVARLEEYRSEESTWFSWFGVFIGLIIGVFTNVATGGQMSKEAWILIIVFAIMTGLTGWFALQARRRGNKLREALFKDT